MRDRDVDCYLGAALAACRRAGEVHRAHFRSADLRVQLKGDSSPVTLADRRAEEVIRESLRRATPELGLLGEELGQEGDPVDRWIIDPLDGTKNFIAGLPYFAVLIALELSGEIALGVIHAPVLGPGAGLEAPPAAEDEGSRGETWWAARGQGAFGGTGTDLERFPWRRLAVSTEGRLQRAFVAHGGLKRFMDQGLWLPFTQMVQAVGRTRGFGDWWGHILVAEGRCDAMLEADVALHDVAAVKVIVEEAGGVFVSRDDAPLEPGFQEAVMSSNRPLATELRRLLGL